MITQQRNLLYQREHVQEKELSNLFDGNSSVAIKMSQEMMQTGFDKNSKIQSKLKSKSSK